MSERTGRVARRRCIPWGDRDRGARAFVRVDRDTTLATVLHQLAPDVRHVYMIGARPGRTPDDFHAWRVPPDGWRVAESGHYLNLSRPVLRYEHEDTGRRVEVQRAAGWIGERADVTPAQCAAAWDLLEAALRRRFDRHAAVLATPATTGRDLWLRSLPRDVEYEVLPADVQELIRETSGQGRVELYTDAETLPGTTALPGLYGYDMRFGYAALVWGLGVGPVQHDDRDEWAGMRRGRYRVIFQVPHDWTHVGLLPVRDADDRRRGWGYPSHPGSCWETWCDGAELHLARAHGWRTRIVERLLLEDGRPLDGWRDRLVQVRDTLASAYRDDPTVAKLAADAARAIVLHTIGAFHAPASTITREVPLDAAHTVSDDAVNMEPAGDVLVVTELRGQAWPECAHPEWSTAVWARCRARMARHALEVPREDIVAIRTDAIYTSAPGPWRDDNRVGGLRRVTRVARPVPTPRTADELLEVRDDAA